MGKVSHVIGPSHSGFGCEAMVRCTLIFFGSLCISRRMTPKPSVSKKKKNAQVKTNEDASRVEFSRRAGL